MVPYGSAGQSINACLSLSSPQPPLRSPGRLGCAIIALAHLTGIACRRVEGTPRPGTHRPIGRIWISCNSVPVYDLALSIFCTPSSAPRSRNTENCATGLRTLHDPNDDNAVGHDWADELDQDGALCPYPGRFSQPRHRILMPSPSCSFRKIGCHVGHRVGGDLHRLHRDAAYLM